jgi:hypothetical protein
MGRPFGRMAKQSARLSASDTARLTATLARITDNGSPTGAGFGLIHGLQLAFGLALTRHTGTSVAQFGLTFSGRGSNTAAAGSLIATLPQRLNFGRPRTRSRDAGRPDPTLAPDVTAP